MRSAPKGYRYDSRLKLTDQAEGVMARTGPVHALLDGPVPKFASGEDKGVMLLYLLSNRLCSHCEVHAGTTEPQIVEIYCKDLKS